MSRTETIELERKTGAKRSIIQVQKTMKFEFKRNWIKLLSMIGTAVLIYVINIVIEILQLNRGGELPETAILYAQSYLGFLTLFIYIVGVTFAGSMISEDFEKSTGNLLFPKIPKHRLLIGRYSARYLYGVVSVLAYYILVGVTTIFRYGELPVQIWLSFGWAIYYLFAVFAFVSLFSSFFKRTSGATIVSLLSLLILFQMVQMIMTFTGVTAEPFYFLTYYSNIISSIFEMPVDRFMVVPFGGPGGEHTFYQWSTPSELGAGIGLLVYSVVLLAGAYIIYRYRQNKANM